jgi:hypothetical protein
LDAPAILSAPDLEFSGMPVIRQERCVNEGFGDYALIDAQWKIAGLKPISGE